MAGLFRAAFCHRRGVEEQYDGTVQEHRRERALVALLILECEVRSEVTFLHELTLRVEAKTYPADRDEVAWGGGVVLDLLTQALDVRVEGAGVREFQSPPQGVETDFTCDDLTESRREERQEVELLAAEFDLLAPARDGSSHEVDTQVTERDDLVVGDR